MIRAIFLTLIVLTAVSSTAAAQAKKANAAKGKRPEASPTSLLTRVSPMRLLNWPSVRTEVELTPAQEARLKECDEKMTRSAQDLRKRLEEIAKQVDPQELAALRQEAAAERDKRERELDTVLLKSLDRTQCIRLEQIGIQKEGFSFFLRPEIQTRLNMDPGQVEAIRQLNSEALQARQLIRENQPQPKALPPLPGQRENAIRLDPKYVKEWQAAREKNFKEQDNVRASSVRQILKVLRKKQLQAYQTMCGEPFDLTSMRPGVPVEPKAKPPADPKAIEKAPAASKAKDNAKAS
jgi:hypothetical protein